MNEKVIVTVKDGKIRGMKNTSKFSGKQFYSFFGVPYGQPTSNQARFKDPMKVKPWKNVLDATVPKGGCVHLSVRVKTIVGSEDCLYNNIHTPNLPSKSDALKAVVVNIHPGGFNIGSPDPLDYGSPDYVMHHDIVYVCIGFRFHIAGFLNLGLEECSGNQGIKDIILGLKWIKDNISVFGGDPENITLLGASSGGTLVHCLMLSPAAKGLFHKAILMCTYFFNPTRVNREENLSLAVEGAQVLGYETADESEKKKLLSFYRKLDLQDSFLPFKFEKVLHKNFVSAFPNFPMNPTIDYGKNAVIPVNMRQLIDSTSRIPIIFGMCEKEAIMGFCRGLRDMTMRRFKTVFRQSCWGWAHHMTDDQTDAMFEEIKSFYLNGDGIENAPLSVLIDILTDAGYSEVYDTLIDLIAADLPSSVYIYKFQYESNGCVNTLKNQISFLIDEPLQGSVLKFSSYGYYVAISCSAGVTFTYAVSGTFHMDDFSYWAYMAEDDGKVNNAKMLTKKDKQVIETYTKFLSTFAKTGDPNNQESGVKWKPSTPEEPCYLRIDDSLTMVEGKLNDKRMKFWQNLRKKYGTTDIFYNS